MALDLNQLRLVLYFAAIVNTAIFLMPESERKFKNVLLAINIPLLNMLSVFAISDPQGAVLGFITHIISFAVFLRVIYHTLVEWLPEYKKKRKEKLLRGNK